MYILKAEKPKFVQQCIKIQHMVGEVLCCKKIVESNTKVASTVT